MRVTHTTRGIPRHEVIHPLIGQYPNCTVQERHIDMLPAPCCFACFQCGLNADHRVEPRKDISKGYTDLLRLTVWRTRKVHPAGHALDQEIIARAIRIRPILSEPRDRTIDQPWIDRRQPRIVEPVFRQPTDLEILNHHIGVADQVDHDLPPFFCAEIGSHHCFSSVRRMVIGSGAVIHERWPPRAGIVAVRAFDLNDLSPEVGQNLTGPRTSQNPRQLDDFHTVQRLHQKNACRPVCARPRINAWMSCVPS